MMEELIELDKKLFLFLNNLHASWLDPVMINFTQTVVWIPLYALLLFLVLKKFRNDSWAPLLCIAITIVLSDQITSGLMKPFFERLRPSRDPEIASLVHTVNGYKGGLYGFASSHAANTLACALYFWLLLKKDYKWLAGLFVWAFVMSYSRIYLGVHYPGDILVGMIIGGICAVAGFQILNFLKRFMKNLPAETH